MVNPFKVGDLVRCCVSKEGNDLDVRPGIAPHKGPIVGQEYVVGGIKGAYVAIQCRTEDGSLLHDAWLYCFFEPVEPLDREKLLNGLVQKANALILLDDPDNLFEVNDKILLQNKIINQMITDLQKLRT